jgi:hypothetical protein
VVLEHRLGELAPDPLALVVPEECTQDDRVALGELDAKRLDVPAGR